MKFKAVIFDMDGVLVDTERAYYQRRLDFFNLKGIDASHLPKNFFTGGRMRDLWQPVLGVRYQDFDIEKLQSDYVNYRNSHSLPYSQLLFPEVRDFLSYLHENNYKIGLASSSDRSQIQKFFAETGLENYFDAVCSGQDFQETKPNPEIYLKAMEKLQVSAEDSLVIEDSSVGIAAGQAAQAIVFAIRDQEFDLDQTGANQIFDNLKEIQEVLSNAN